MTVREHLAELDTPLVEAVDLPDHSLGEDLVLVERHELAQDRWRQRGATMVVVGRLPGNDLVRDELVGDALGATSSAVLPKREGLGLRQTVRDQQVVLIAARRRWRSCRWARDRDEVGRHDRGALVKELVERVLAVGPGSPQMMGPVSPVTGVPSSRTCLPLLSMSSCWR